MAFWHIRPVSSQVDIPGGELTDAYPPFSRTALPSGGQWSGDLFIRENPGYEGTLFFTDPFTTMFLGDASSSWRCRPLSYETGGSPSIDWTRMLDGEEYSVHQSDGAGITHSMFLPFGAVGSTVFRCRTPDGFVFTASYTDEVAAGVHFIAYSELSGAPALGTGDLPAVTLKHAFDNENGCPGAVLVGDTYYFIEPVDDFYSGGSPKMRLSSYDLGSSTYVQGAIMPAAAYRGLAYSGSGNIFYTMVSEAESREKGLYEYDAGGNTLTLLVKSQSLALVDGIGLGLSTTATPEFELTYRPLDSSPAPTGGFDIEYSDGTATSLPSFSGELLPASTIAIFTFRLTDIDYDDVTWYVEWREEGVGSYATATLITGPEYPVAQGLPSPGRECTFQWDTTEAGPLASVDVRVRISAPADSTAVMAATVLELTPVEVPAVNEPVDMVNAANNESPLVVAEASAGSATEANKEADLVLVGKGFQVPDSFGDPRVRSVMLKSSRATQVFDFTRFTLSSGPDGDILNLRATIANSGTYDVFLLDKDGNRIATFLAAVKVG